MLIKNLPNQQIRKEFREAGITFWQIAKYLNVCDMTVSRWLRNDPLPGEIETKLRNAMNMILKEREPQNEQ